MALGAPGNVDTATAAMESGCITAGCSLLEAGIGLAAIGIGAYFTVEAVRNLFGAHKK